MLLRMKSLLEAFCTVARRVSGLGATRMGSLLANARRNSLIPEDQSAPVEVQHAADAESAAGAGLLPRQLLGARPLDRLCASMHCRSIRYQLLPPS